MFLPSGFPLLARGLSGQRAALIGHSQAPAEGTGVSWSPPSPSLQEEASGPALANQERAPSRDGTDVKVETPEDA